MRKVAVVGLMILVFMTSDLLFGRSLPEITQASIDELGVTYGVPQMSGFVFVDGQYIPPPYTVTRRGNAIFINRVQIEQPVAWSYFDSSAEAALPPKGSTASDEEGDFLELNDQGNAPVAEAAPEKVSSIDDLFSDDADDNAAPAPAKPAESKTISSIDDLFGDDDDNTPVVNPSPRKISSIDDLFGDDEEQNPVVKRKSGAVSSIADLFGEDNDEVAADVEKKPLPGSGEVVKKIVVPQTKEELARKKEILKKRLEDKRYSYECAIAKGELYFFGTSYKLINGNYGTARTLLEVLPGALRYSRSPDDLLNRLQAGDVYFLDLNVCQALYRNKTTFPLLQQRLDKIKQMEALRDAQKE